jgi:uncharacterized membrane protein
MDDVAIGSAVDIRHRGNALGVGLRQGLVTRIQRMLDFLHNSNPLLADLAFRGTFSAWLAYPLMVLAIAAAFFIYFRESMKMDLFQRLVLGGLRALTLVAIIFLLRKPVIVDDVTGYKSRPIAIVLDNSQSMTQHDPRLNSDDRLRIAIANNQRAPDAGLGDPGSLADLPADRPTRAEIVRAVFNNPRLKLVDGLRPKGPLQTYLFGQRLHGVGDTPANPWLNSFTADETRTALADSLGDLLQRDENELPAAVLLITDGRDNSSSAPLEEVGRECARLKVPLHIYGVGGSSQGYLQLKDVPVQDTLFVEDTVSVPFRWRAQGFKEGEVVLSLSLNGRPVGEPKRVPVRDGDDFTETVTFTPDKRDAQITGKQELVATIKLTQGDQVFSDQITKTVRVVDRKVKLLFIENTPRWEFKFMQRAFLRDRRVEPSFLVVNGDRKAMESGAPFVPAFPNTRKDLFSYDLIIVGDVDGNFFTAEQRNWLRDYVTEGGGLVMVAGREHAPATYLHTPLEDVLPVEFQAQRFPLDSNERTEEYQPRLTDVGERSAMMSLADSPEENQRVWRSLPGWNWNYPITKLKPGATALLEHPRKQADGKPMPLMALHYYGKGLVLFCATDETWRWRYNEADKYFGRFWGQVIYQVGLPHTLGSKSAQLALEEGEAVLGKPARVFARLFTPEFRPLTTERIAARLERLDAKPGEERFRSVTLESVPNQPGEYVATLPNDRVGRFVLKVESGAEPATLEYRVTLPPEHELAPSSMNEDALRKLAEQSGGKFYREEDLHRLASDVTPQQVKFTQRQEVLLWTSWWTLLAVVLLFTAEWVIRKFSNLS